MESIITGKLYGKVGVKTTDYDIKHAKGLSNEVSICESCSKHVLTAKKFRTYANFECDSWKWAKSS